MEEAGDDDDGATPDNRTIKLCVCFAPHDDERVLILAACAGTICTFMMLYSLTGWWREKSGNQLMPERKKKHGKVRPRYEKKTTINSSAKVVAL